MATVAVVGGTGTGQLLSHLVREEVRVETPHGPVAMLRAQTLGDPLYFLSRHGLEHHVAPHEIRHAAHFAALQKVGVTRAIALYATGGLHPDLHPGTVVMLSDLIECSSATAPDIRPHVPLRHADMTEPYCRDLSQTLTEALEGLAAPVVPKGTYCHVAGPRYETPAEVRLFGAWGGTVVGMTALPEAVLAREAGLCWAALAVVTNYGVGLKSQRVCHGSVASGMRKTVTRIGPAVLRAADAARRMDRCPHCAGNAG